MALILYSQTNLSFGLINSSLLGAANATELSLDSTTLRYLAGKRTALSQIALSDFRGKNAFITPTIGNTNSINNTVLFSSRRPAFVIGTVNAVVSSFHEGLDTGYTDYTYLGSNVVIGATLTSSDLRTPGATYYPEFENAVSNFVVPSGCSTITIQAWGGGGGSGGSWTSGSSPGNGGAGGYATTTITVGTDVFVGQVLCCMAGAGGAGGSATWYTGNAGWASAVYVLEGSSWYPDSALNWNSANYKDLFSAANCVLIAGGGGGGGGINWSVGSSGSGGSGGSADSGSAGFYSGSGTGATTTAHGNGFVANNPGFVKGVIGGGLHLDATRTAGTAVFFEEAVLACLGPSSINTAANETDRAAGLTYLGSGHGGGGAFCGAPNPQHFADQGSTGGFQRGSGSGSNKVYRGSGSTASSGISSTPPNPQGTVGYGGAGKGPLNPNVANRYAGVSGKPGQILITFNA
jgi:hypothetical protein